MAGALERLGSVLRRRGDDAGAERAIREALAASRRVFPGPNGEHAGITMRLADLLDTRTAARAEVESLYAAAVAEMRAALGATHTWTANAMMQEGEMLADHGRTVEGERLVREALALQRRAWGPSQNEVASTMITLGHILSRDGYSAEAEQLTRGALAIYGTTLGTGHSAYAGTLGYLADILAQRGALDSAEAYQRRAVAIRTVAAGPEQGITALSVGQLARVLTMRHRYREADSLFRWTLGVLRRYTTDRHVDVRRTYAGFAALFDARGMADSAAKYRRLATP
jgi:tetratricopeptide (TPR) repeat protein